MMHLTLSPLKRPQDLSGEPVVPMATLPVGVCMELNAQLRDLRTKGGSRGWGVQKVFPQPVPNGFGIIEVTHADTNLLAKDLGGDRLTWLAAHEFAKVDLWPGAYLRRHPEPAAALAYIRALPLETPIILCWW